MIFYSTLNTVLRSYSMLSQSTLYYCTAVPAKLGGSTTGQLLARSNRWGWNVDPTIAYVLYTEGE